MPKLTSYINKGSQEQHDLATSQSSLQVHHGSNKQSDDKLKVRSDPPYISTKPYSNPIVSTYPSPPLPSQQQPRPPPDSTSPPPPEFHLAATKLGEAYHKRICDHGPRTYRWPDGSLKPEKPPENPYTVANRRRWAPLVDHCRRHGGDHTFELTGHSLRYGLNVPYCSHETYLTMAELVPEKNRNGELAAYHPQQQQQRPLDDPEHCFNTYYKEEASLVFSKATGRLL